MESIQTGRHALLPQHLNVADLANWLMTSAVDRFTDSQKRIFSPDDLTDFEHESSKNGREINRLMDILADAKDHIVKGGEEPLTLTLPPTAGTKKLDKFRRQNDDLIETGFELVEMEIFGIPNPENEMMEYFDIEGNHILDRQRPLSAKEKHTHLGMFQKGSNSKLFVANRGGAAGNADVDEDTGEFRDGTNN